MTGTTLLPRSASAVPLRWLSKVGTSGGSVAGAGLAAVSSSIGDMTSASDRPALTTAHGSSPESRSRLHVKFGVCASRAAAPRISPTPRPSRGSIKISGAIADVGRTDWHWVARQGGAGIARPDFIFSCVDNYDSPLLQSGEGFLAFHRQPPDHLTTGGQELSLSPRRGRPPLPALQQQGVVSTNTTPCCFRSAFVAAVRSEPSRSRRSGWSAPVAAARSCLSLPPLSRGFLWVAIN